MTAYCMQLLRKFVYIYGEVTS